MEITQPFSVELADVSEVAQKLDVAMVNITITLALNMHLFQLVILLFNMLKYYLGLSRNTPIANLKCEMAITLLAISHHTIR